MLFLLSEMFSPFLSCQITPPHPSVLHPFFAFSGRPPLTSLVKIILHDLLLTLCPLADLISSCRCSSVPYRLTCLSLVPIPDVKAAWGQGQPWSPSFFTEQTHIPCLLYARQSAKCFTNITSFNHYQMRKLRHKEFN